MDNQNNSNPTPPDQNASLSNPWAPPVQPESIPTPPAPPPNTWPAAPLPATPPPDPLPTPASTWPAAPPDPTPQTTQPIQNPAMSPLDNPWGSPTQPPSIDGGPTATQPSWMGTNPTESTPTDLSHLITNNHPQADLSGQTVPESLVVPSNPMSTPGIPTIPTQEHRGIPKWLIGVGAGLLILVIGASAYFILGIGQPSKETTSLPATTKTTEVKPPAPIPTPPTQPSAQPAASSSANFGQLGGSSETQQQATSAADAARQRTQGR